MNNVSSTLELLYSYGQLSTQILFYLLLRCCTQTWVQHCTHNYALYFELQAGIDHRLVSEGL
jgi:hypothetical protein